VGPGDVDGGWEGALFGGKGASGGCGGETGIEGRDDGSLDGFGVVRGDRVEVPGRRGAEWREVLSDVDGHCGLWRGGSWGWAS